MYIYTLNLYVYAVRVTAPCVTLFPLGCTTASERKAHNAVKTDRQSVIRDLLAKAPIASQDDLRRKLAARGFHVTQATLSRDIRELKLSKGPGGYALPNVPIDEDDDAGPAIEEVLSDFGLEVRLAQNLVVVISTTGGAQPIAATIDYEEWPEVVGTIAGDDTVLIICPNPRKAAILKTRIEAHIG